DGIRDDLVTGVQTCALPIYHLRLLTEIPLKFAPDEQIEFLIRAADLNVRFYRNRIIPLQERIVCFRKRDRLSLLNSLGKIISFRSEERRVGKEGKCERTGGN